MKKEINLPNGSRYYGEYEENIGGIVLKGNGRIEHPNGDNYVGEFNNGYAHGYGIYSFADGESHEGTFSYNEPQGLGLHVYRNKDVYIGWFNNAKRNKFGLYIGQELAFGRWAENKFIEDLSYETRFVTKMAETGLGIANYYKKEGFYFGEKAYNDRIAVLGIIFYNNGEIYMGKILNGKRHGFGKLLSIHDNSIIEAMWELNVKIKDC